MEKILKNVEFQLAESLKLNEKLDSMLKQKSTFKNIAERYFNKANFIRNKQHGGLENCKCYQCQDLPIFFKYLKFQFIIIIVFYFFYLIFIFNK